VISATIDTAPGRAAQYDFDHSHTIGVPPQDVANVGDKAFYLSDLRMLIVLKGNNLLHLSVTDLQVADPKAADIQVAAVVMGNLR
jgi:hypothetical protein